MGEVQVNPIGAQSPQAFLHLFEDVPAGQAKTPRPVAYTVSALGGNDDLFAGTALCHPPAAPLLGVPTAVGVRRVEHRDSELPGTVHHRECFRLILTLAEKP